MLGPVIRPDQRKEMKWMLGRRDPPHNSACGNSVVRFGLAARNRLFMGPRYRWPASDCKARAKLTVFVNGRSSRWHFDNSGRRWKDFNCPGVGECSIFVDGGVFGYGEPIIRWGPAVRNGSGLFPSILGWGNGSLWGLFVLIESFCRQTDERPYAQRHLGGASH